MACPSVIAQVLAAGAYDDGHRGQQDGDASENGADRRLGDILLNCSIELGSPGERWYLTKDPHLELINRWLPLTCRSFKGPLGVRDTVSVFHYFPITSHLFSLSAASSAC
jgi:hypothetical protein